MTLRIDKKPAVTGICGYCQIPRADPLLKSAVIPHSAPRQKPEVPYQRNRWFADLYGSFSVKWFLFVAGSLFGAERLFLVPSPAIRFAERAEGVKGPKC